MDLLVVLQTHALGDSQAHLGKQRYCGATKSEVMRRCVSSLVRSMHLAQAALREVRLRLVVLDDHSDPESLAHLHAILRHARFPCELHGLASRGVMASILSCYRLGLTQGREWVYFVQDDYLYDPRAITQMLQVSREFSANLGAPVSVYPFNDPFRYWPENVKERVHIVRGCDRHWRTNYHTASCFMTHHTVLQGHWDLFEAFGQSPVLPTMEDDTINQLFISRGLVLFTPIPSLALHMQYDTEQDPFIDWRTWWNEYEAGAGTYARGLT